MFRNRHTERPLRTRLRRDPLMAKFLDDPLVSEQIKDSVAGEMAEEPMDDDAIGVRERVAQLAPEMRKLTSAQLAQVEDLVAWLRRQ